MVSRRVKFTYPMGMHMRPAQILATELGKYDCNITILFGEKTIDAKNLMNLMASCIKMGSEIEIRCDGAQETEALAAAVALVRSGLGSL